MDKIDNFDKPVHDFIHDYEATGNYGEEVNYLDDEIHEVEDEVYEDFEDNADVYNKWKTQ
mgnify:CR=1 FL=1